MTWTSAALTFLLVMDPLGNVPLFLAALRNTAPERRVRVILRELLIALGIMLVFLFSGRFLLNLLHVSQEALMVSGGVILLLIAVRMVFPTPEKNLHEPVNGEPFIVPLAVPYLAGPSLLATLILVSNSGPATHWPWWLLALGVAWLVSAVVLLSAGWLQRFVGERALVATERLMGMVLVMIGVQMMLEGLKAFVLS
ncbi:MarC family protein [Propionibacteriaceae bacterium Y1923]|uniref:MarC family protein n=1 Tax=Aestuariimicrobium sp. Y1814 TaxID=3418742 RepID=UPI003C152B9A